MAITVSTSAQLKSALSSAKAGDTILLASGNYGSVTLSNVDFSSTVTIQSASSSNKAVFSEFAITGSSNIKVSGVHVSASSNGGNQVVLIDNSKGIDFVNSEINGKVDDTFPITGPKFGVYVSSNSSDITIQNNNVHDVWTGGAFFGVKDIRVVGNSYDRIGEDAMKFAGASQVLIEDNMGPKTYHSTSDAHEDFIQFQGSGTSSDITIRGNVLMPQNKMGMQGIFLKGEFKNVLVEQNVIYSSMGNGIYVDNGSNVSIKNNTLINASMGTSNDQTTRIYAPGASITDNIFTRNWGASTEGSNIVVQYTDKGKPNYIGDVLGKLDDGKGMTMEMMKTINSRFGSDGAMDRVKEVLSGVVDVVKPTPTPKPTPEPEPDPDPVKPAPTTPTDGTTKVAYQLKGDHQFSGQRGDSVEASHTKAMALSSGSIAFTFDADDIHGRHALVTKDAAGYASGGNHFSSYIKDGELFVVFEDEKSSVEFKVGGIDAGKEYDVLATFDAKTVGLYVDGKLIGTKAFTMDWTQNDQGIHVGGMGYTDWNTFDGTISDVLVMGGVKTPAQIAAVQSGKTTTSTTVADDKPIETVTDKPDATGDAAAVFKMLGDREFSGETGTAKEYAHTRAMELSEGSIAFRFDSDDVNGKHGLVSKDDTGYVDGGNHFTSWIEDGTLLVRFEDDDSLVDFVVDGIKANTDYSLLATFDDNTVGLYLNGKLIGTEKFAMDWTDNNQTFEIGGVGYTDRFVFDGTISDVVVFDEVVTPKDYDLFV